MFLITIVLAIPLGKYIGKVYEGEKTWPDRFLNPLDKLFFKLGGINPKKEMNWKQHLVALLIINLVWLVFSMFILMNMSWLPLNPDGNTSMSADLAFNTSVSFITNTNLQHYSGESAVSYLGQLVLMLFQFISAGTGMAICAVVFVAMKERTTEKLGNFYNFFVKSCTRILLPLAIVVAILLVFNGTPMTFEGEGKHISMQGDMVNVSLAPWQK
jgi:K+-transporting ATPase ATPase A chain